METYQEAIVGWKDDIPVYGFEKLVAEVWKEFDQGTSIEDVIDWIDYNVIGNWESGGYRYFMGCYDELEGWLGAGDDSESEASYTGGYDADSEASSRGEMSSEDDDVNSDASTGELSQDNDE